MVVVIGPISFWGNVTVRALQRCMGTVFGAASGLVALYLELYSMSLMLVWCTVVMFVCGIAALGKRPYMGLLIGITLCVVSAAGPGDIQTALLRSVQRDHRLAAGAAVCQHLSAAGLHPLAVKDEPWPDLHE